MEDETHSTVLNVLRGIICLVGVIGNLIVIFVVVVLREYKKTTVLRYVLQLAVADLFFLLTIPFQIVEHIEGVWKWSNGLCKTKQAMLYINYYASVLFLMVMSLDRCLAVCHGFSTRLQKLRSKRVSWAIIALIWGVSVLLCTPILIYSKKTGDRCLIDFPGNKSWSTTDYDEMSGSGENDSLSLDYYNGDDDYAYYDPEYYQENSNVTWFHGNCYYALESDSFIGYIYFNFIIMFVIPCIVMSICYCLIVMRLKNVQTPFSQSNECNSGNCDVSNDGERRSFQSGSEVKVKSNRRRISIVCVSLVILFVTCWLPFHSVHMAKIKGIKGSYELCHRLGLFSSLFVFLNSALNPYIYNFVTKGFGKRLRSAAIVVKSSIKKGGHLSNSNRFVLKYKSPGKDGTNNSETVMTKIYKKGKTGTRSISSHLSISNDQAQK